MYENRGCLSDSSHSRNSRADSDMDLFPSKNRALTFQSFHFFPSFGACSRKIDLCSVHNHNKMSLNDPAEDDHENHFGFYVRSTNTRGMLVDPIMYDRFGTDEILLLRRC